MNLIDFMLRKKRKKNYWEENIYICRRKCAKYTYDFLDNPFV